MTQRSIKLRDSYELTSLRWIRFWLGVVVFGLVVSGATAIPLVTEADLMHRVVNKYEIFGPGVREWVQTVYAGILDSNARYPFLFYGTDWLAFGHFVIAIAFIGPLRDPVRNKWVIEFGMIACVLIIPYAFVFGAVRGIPVWWRLIDCSFGVLGLIPLWLARRWTKRLEAMQGRR
jgi:hypothetical protein